MTPEEPTLSREQREYEAYWAAQMPKRGKYSALGWSLVPCSECGTVGAFAQCGLCSCEMLVRVRGLA